jgi:rubrerythrin
MKKTGIKELLEMALAIERTGRDIFLRFAERYSHNQPLATMFSKLAHEEEGHIMAIEDLEKKFSFETGLFKELYNLHAVRQHFHDYSFTHVMAKYKKILARARNLAHEFEAVKIGLNLEIDSITFYKKFQSFGQTDPEVAKLLHELLMFEISHMERLAQYLKEAV